MPFDLTGLLLPEQHCDLWQVNLDNLADSSGFLASLLNEPEKARLSRFTNPNAALAFLGSRGFLRLLGSKYLNIPSTQIRIGIAEHGKPFFEDFPNLHFNVSHSRNCLVLLFAPCQCGVDVECTSRKIDYTPIMTRFFGETEILSWKKQADPANAFFRGWTRKEAYLKATGEGISGLRKVQVSFSPSLPKPVISIEDQTTQCSDWNFCEFFIEPDFVGAIALLGPELVCHFRSLKNFT